MYIRFGFEISYDLPAATDMVLLLHLRPELAASLRRPETLRHNVGRPAEIFLDAFGNRATRLHAPAGTLTLTLDSLCEIPGDPDPVHPEARQHEIADLPPGTLPFLLPSRYCETDRLGAFAWSTFGHLPAGWARVQAICDFVHNHIRFDYKLARPTRTALEASQERVGVCRDFAHLAMALCRCLNIPARYATGYLGDIGVPPDPAPMDFSAWFEVFLDGRWYAFDARHNHPRIGRLVMARGRDAADCALITTFGPHVLGTFRVWTDEVPARVPAHDAVLTAA